MNKFKKGDRVRVISKKAFVPFGETGTVLDDSGAPYLAMDNPIGQHDCCGMCEMYHGTCVVEEDLELIQLTNTVTLILGNTAYEITGENITIKTKQL